MKFDSTTEAQLYLKLKKAKDNGDILDFDMKSEYTLQEEFINWRGKKESSIKHFPDYLVTLKDGTKAVLDSKGSSFHTTDSKIKRKMWMKLHPDIPYYYVSVSPKYIGGEWVETTPGFDFLKKIVNKYNALHPGVNKRLKSAPKMNIYDWDKWFVYKDIAGIFYVWEKTYTKKELEKIDKDSKK